MSIDLTDIGSGYNRSTMNSNFTKIEDFLNDEVLKREIAEGEANEMRTHLDLNTNRIVNVADGVDPQDVLTVQQGTVDGIIGPQGIQGVPGPAVALDVTNYGVVAGVDSTAAMVVAMNAATVGDTLWFPPSVTEYIADIWVDKGVTIDLGGNSIVAANSSTGTIRGMGEVVSSTSMTAAAVRGDFTISLVSVVGMVEGSMLLLSDDMVRPSDSAKINYEPCIISSISGLDVTMTSPLRFRKSNTGSVVSLINPLENVTVKNGHIRDTALQLNDGAFFMYTKNFRMEDIRVTEMSKSGCELQHSIEARIDLTYTNPRGTGSGQGNAIVLFGCKDVEVNVRSQGTRHSVDLSAAFDVRGYGEASDGVSTDLYIAHNSVGGNLDMKFKSFNNLNGKSMVVGKQGVFDIAAPIEADLYSVECAGINIDMECIQKTKTPNNVGAYFEIPIVESTIRMKGTIGSAPYNADNNTQCVRMVPIYNRDVDLYVDSTGYDACIYFASATLTETATTEPDAGVTIRELRGKGWIRGVAYYSTTHVDVRSADMSDQNTSGSPIFLKRVSSNLVKMRRLNLQNINIKGSAQLWDIQQSRTDIPELRGDIGLTYTDENTVLYAIPDTFYITEQMLATKGLHGVIRCAPVAPVIGTATAFARGVYPGQILTLHNTTANTITVLKAFSVQNTGGVSVVLSQFQSASWRFNGISTWIQIS